MSELKTKKNNASVQAFIASIEDDQKRKDSQALLALFIEVTGEEPKMWGDSIIGVGQYHYTYKGTGREGDWMLTGFSPRKQNLTVYIMPGFAKYQDLLKKLGKHTTSVSCLYIKRLSDIDLTVLRELLKDSFNDMRRSNPST